MKTLEQQLRQRAPLNWEEHWGEIQKVIEQAIITIAATVTVDEAKVEELTRAARAGASYVAILEATKRVADDAAEEARPSIAQFMDAFGKIVVTATSETIQEHILEKLQQRKRGTPVDTLRTNRTLTAADDSLEGEW